MGKQFKVRFVLAAFLVIQSQAFASDLSSQFLPPKSVRIYEKYKHEAQQALDAANFAQAEKALVLECRAAKEIGAIDTRYADSLKELADYYCLRGQFSRAQPLYEQAEGIREKALGSADIEVALGAARLAQFYLAHDSLEKAKDLAQKLVLYGEMRVAQKERRRASANGAAATPRSLADQFLELAASFDGLATAFKGKGNYEQAEPLYKIATTMRERALKPDHLALASSYENLAALYMLKGKYKDAVPLFNHSLAITDKTLGKENALALKRLNELGRSYTACGKFHEADSVFKQGLAILASLNKQDADIYLSLGDLYRAEQNYGQAERYLNKALVLMEKLHGSQHCDLVPVLETYADVLEKMHRDKQAQMFLARARSIGGT